MSADNSILVVERDGMWAVWESVGDTSFNEITMDIDISPRAKTFDNKADALLEAAAIFERSSIIEYGIRVIPEQKIKLCPTCKKPLE